MESDTWNEYGLSADRFQSPTAGAVDLPMWDKLVLVEDASSPESGSSYTPPSVHGYCAGPEGGLPAFSPSPYADLWSGVDPSYLDLSGSISSEWDWTDDMLSEPQRFQCYLVYPMQTH